MLVNNKITSSKREAREFLGNGSISVNGEKVTDEALVLSSELAIEGKFIVLRRGKKLYALVRY